MTNILRTNPYPMEKADRHLEATLQELNDRVNELEDGSDSAGLLDAYVNRSSVLNMLGYRSSAYDDLESASEIVEDLNSQGVRLDPGILVKIHASMASIIFDLEGDPVDEYAIVSVLLPEFRSSSRHYDRRWVARMCITACSSLLVCDHPEEVAPFVDKGLQVLSGSDPWTDNRRMELYFHSGEANDYLDRVEESVEDFTCALEIGTSLMERGQLEDFDLIVLMLASRAEGRTTQGREDLAIIDLTVAVDLLEDRLSNHALNDVEALVSLHHDLAGLLMKNDRVEEAERHMIRAMEVSIGQPSSQSDDGQFR